MAPVTSCPAAQLWPTPTPSTTWAFLPRLLVSSAPPPPACHPSQHTKTPRSTRQMKHTKHASKSRLGRQAGKQAGRQTDGWSSMPPAGGSSCPRPYSSIWNVNRPLMIVGVLSRGPQCVWSVREAHIFRCRHQRSRTKRVVAKSTYGLSHHVAFHSTSRWLARVCT